MIQSFERFSSPVVSLPVDNVDTDQIIPARFLKTTRRDGFADALFFDWRYLPDGSPDPSFVLNQERARKASVLVSGDNFGCGSSREHAPWALVEFGFRAILAIGFADIFRKNALENGLLPITLPRDVIESLVAISHSVSTSRVVIDLHAQIVELPDGREQAFTLDAFARRCLLEGGDTLGFLLAQTEAIDRFEKTRGYASCTSSRSRHEDGSGHAS
jgi:3-isopropylmalate/(R)-2-methylmalate dehydratase small subunit